MRTSGRGDRRGPSLVRKFPAAWGVFCGVVSTTLYLGCSDKPPAGKVTEAGQNGGNSTTGNGGNSSGTTGVGGTTGTGATGVGGTPPGAGSGGTNNPGGSSNGGNAGAGNTSGNAGMGGMVVERQGRARPAHGASPSAHVVVRRREMKKAGEASL